MEFDEPEELIKLDAPVKKPVRQASASSNRSKKSSKSKKGKPAWATTEKD